MLNLSKAESDNLLNLRKNTLQLCLEKTNLLNTKARVAVALDFSGSMSRLYKDGSVQAVIERLLPIAVQFDDNGEMELWLFDNGYKRMPNISLNNYYGYIKREILDKGYRMGGTCYAPVMKDIANKYIKEEPMPIADYVIFITDGANSDRAAAKETIVENANYPIFWQFVGIGNERFEFLRKLDELDGRYVDNANFFALDDIERVADSVLYQRLLNEYPGWLALPEVQKMISGQPAKKGFFRGLFG
jgi:hypothetical protein